MGFFNFNRFRQKTEDAEVKAADSENINQTPLDDRVAARKVQEEAALKQDRERQERKVVGMVLYGAEAMRGHDVEIDDETKERAYQKMYEDPYCYEEVRDGTILRIKTPNQMSGNSAEAVFQKMDNRHSRRIFAYMGGMPDTEENMQSISSEAVTELLRKFPHPRSFEMKSREMLEKLREKNTLEKYQQYVADMEKFKRQLYGKRWDYYEAFRSIEQQADKYMQTQEKRKHVMEAMHRKEADDETVVALDRTLELPKSNTMWTPEQMREQVEVRQVSRQEREKLLREGRIDGDDYIHDGKRYKLTTEALEREGFAPEFRYNLCDGVNVATSRPFKDMNGRDAVMAYVTTERGTQVVSYYRSKSQGRWRLLPDYVWQNTPGETHMSWYGKGYSEESLNLPAVSQCALEVIAKQPQIKAAPYMREFAFTGTAKRYDSKDEYRQAMRDGTLRGEVYEEIDRAPAIMLDKLEGRIKNVPENLQVAENLMPNFARSGMSFNASSPIYGNFRTEYYMSHDGRLRWAMNSDDKGRAWVGGVETNSSINSAGLHRQWVEAGDFATPLYEYEVMSAGYGDTSDRKANTQYVGMWKNYLSKMPVIRKFLESKHSRQ